MAPTPVSRRQFLRTAATTLAAPYVLRKTAWGGTPPSERITLGVIGVGNMGGAHVESLVKHRSFQILAVCDVRRDKREPAKKKIEDAYAEEQTAGTYRGCETYHEFEALLARPDIDAVVIAVPDHWHAIVAVAACRAGKDVYCEKPLSLTVREAEELVRAARRYGRVFQVGSQQRSDHQFRLACELDATDQIHFYNLGNALYEQGQMDEAIDSFGKALYLKPDYAEAWNGMGNALYNQGTIDGAIACFHKAIKSRPDLTEAYVRLGNMLREQGDLDGATENFHKALALNPDYASAYIGLGRIHQNTGQFADANACFDRAFALEPDNPSAWAEWAWLRKMTSDDRPWSETAQHLLKKSKRLLGEMRLCYALGKYHDDTHQYETSFGYYARANRLRQKITGPFDRDAFVRFVDEIISAYPLEPIRRATGASNSRQPVFVVGMPRSGSSLTEQILSSHPEVFGAGELSFWQTQVDAHSTAMPDWLSDSALLQKIASRCEAELRRHSATALRVVDKMPGNFMHLGLIHAVFPQARILHTQRNPVDTCLSVYFQNFNGHTYANDLDDLAFYYREYRRLMAHWRAVLPPEVFMDVPYEALVEDQEGWSRRIIEFIGLEWDERCLNFHETERKVGTASNWQVRQKIYKTSKERWRNYEQFVGPLLSLLEPAE